MGDPETSVELDGGAEITVGLLVPCPWGVESEAILTIHAHRNGRITLAIDDAIRIDHQPPAMDMSKLQSNPRRVIDREDGA